MTTAYELEIKKHCPQAGFVFDLYHVVAKYGREVIDRVRVDQANQLRHDKPARKILKSSSWLLPYNRHNLKPEQAVHLKRNRDSLSSSAQYQRRRYQQHHQGHQALG